MNKRIFNLLITIGIPLLLATCTTSTDFNPSSSFGSTVDLTGSTLSNDQNNTSLYYSTDNGTTFVSYPILKSGQKFKVRVVDNALNNGSGLFLTNTIADSKSSPFYTFDWSGSTPAPDNATADAPEFTYTGSNKIFVKVIDMHCPFDPTFYTGGWLGDEGTIEVDSAGIKVSSIPGGIDLSDFTQDSSDPNKIWMTNIWGDGSAQKAYMQFSPSTSYWDQTVNIPLQTTAEGGKFSGTGKYDQCRGTLTLNVTYDNIQLSSNGFGYTLKWTYSFTKAAYCATDASSWAGAYSGAEGTVSQTNPTGSFPGSTDKLTITLDPNNSNGLILHNYFGDSTPTSDVTVSMVLSTSTNYFDQVVTMPQQTTVEGGVVTGSGTYDQCAKTITISTSYDFTGSGGSKYSWTYKITK